MQKQNNKLKFAVAFIVFGILLLSFISALPELGGSYQIHSRVTISDGLVGWQLKSAGDLNNDGTPDLFFQEPTGKVAVWFMNSNGTLKSSSVISNTATSWQLKSAGDLNNDGTPDLFFQEPTGKVAVWFMNSNGTLKSSSVISNTATSWQLKAVGVINGKNHLFFQDSSGALAYWVVNSLGTFISSNLLPSPGVLQLKAVGILYGKSSLFFQDSSTDLSIWVLDSSGTSISSIYGVIPNTPGLQLKTFAGNNLYFQSFNGSSIYSWAFSSGGIPACTESNWNSSALTPTICPSSGVQTRTWSKIGSCAYGVSHLVTESVSCCTSEFNEGYLQININETLVTNATEVIGINTVFDSQENLYGDYSWSVQEYDNETPSTYILRTYDQKNKLLGAYSLYTGLVVYYDNFGNENDPGGVELLNESQTSTIIPQDLKINRITLQLSNETEKNLSGFNPYSLSCKRTCKLPGETGILGKDSCCSGYTQISSDGVNLGCIKTDDNICNSTIGENQYNSFNDCFDINSYSCYCNFSCYNDPSRVVSCDNSCYVKNMFGGCTLIKDVSCGDGIIEPINYEECDDGNIINGDGCSSDCKAEIDSNCSIGDDGSVLFNGISHPDTCDGNKLIIYSCDLNVLRIYKLIFNKFSWADIHSFNQNVKTCEYGCLSSKCLTQEEYLAFYPKVNLTSLNLTLINQTKPVVSLTAGPCEQTGIRKTINNTLFYCDLSGNYTSVKSDEASCNNNFECLNNLCSNGECVNLYAEAKNNKNLAENVDTNANN